MLRDQSSVHQSSNVPSHCNSGNTSNTSNSSKCSSHLKYPRTQCGGPIINNSRKNNNTYASKCNISKNNYQQIPQKEEKLQNLMKSHNNSGLSCASGHILNYFKTPNSSFTCDACNVSFLTNTEMAGCRRCNFDLCLSCITLQGKSFSQSTSSSCSVTNRSSSISSQTSKSENQCGPPRAKFICDVSLPDGSILKVDETAVKSWRISNPGTAQWPIGVQLVHVGGHLLGSQNPMPIPSLHPKEEFNLALPIQAPAHPGRYVGYWRLMTSGNNQSRFGHRLWADITCVEKDKLEESQTYLKYKTQHDKLKELGYSNIARNIDILERHNGDLDKAIFEMLDGKDESQ